MSLKQWHGVAVMSEEEPRLVMEFLLSVQQFDLAVDWAELHNLPGHFHKVRYFKVISGINSSASQPLSYELLIMACFEFFILVIVLPTIRFGNN